ncbi:MAG: ParB/RepB/Spo0J family partition protein [Elusimicrobiota bacterium]
MRKALGRGLDALLVQTPDGGGSQDLRSDGRRVPIKSIKPSRLQPRKNFDAERLSELSQSIKEYGLAQPIVVSYDAITNTYELIAGERRLRACELAGLTHIEVVVRTPKSDRERLALSLVENIQRDDLNAIETAVAYKRLIDEFEVNQSQLSHVLGKSKSAISNTLRLLDLPEEIQKAVQFEQLTEGHARALLMVGDPVKRHKLFQVAVEQRLSVRDVEGLAKRVQAGGPLPGERKAQKLKPIKSADVNAMESELEKAFGTRVEIRTRKDEKSGRIVIHFYNLTDFDNIRKAIIKQ